MARRTPAAVSCALALALALIPRPSLAQGPGTDESALDPPTEPPRDADGKIIVPEDSPFYDEDPPPPTVQASEDEPAAVDAASPKQPRCPRQKLAWAGEGVLTASAGLAVALLLPWMLRDRLGLGDDRVVSTLAYTGLGVLGVGMIVGLPMVITACKQPAPAQTSALRRPTRRLRVTPVLAPMRAGGQLGLVFAF